MALPKKKFREAVLQILFCNQFSSAFEEQALIPFMMREFQVTKRRVREVLAFASNVLEKAGECDALIARFSHEFSLERIPWVERSVLRLALFELLFQPEIPPKVAFSEAIRLARKFATRESARFINALLDAVYKDSCAEKPSLSAG
ncbi:MAG: transcription antitermination factor NusB [Chlamydiae bacterium GWC2_50_10]|nr:MAG: transcription antitermination factor NusB [Chlamydiae bacterium GWA2_50_15]OGN53797.1 MAG: transcription antitermination factor NusB [Chlamydiae bacterium GWC2_50_10]OGN55070.1 MAG: transcription antitermination factor NusB [Chlamydiae bacterium GWF2_49_8]OGN63459.1 MAG: transcription antitermination factor NusB [Chlamydiae bacterium RIFCSPHIGHO2_12_FULL_49_32]OGN68255.1 MAG: transcription antitermination factor NusB [Chlamydiae bacterium RIFCSPLOWO2_02_FULL_49_12]HAZ15866.1 transcript